MVLSQGGKCLIDAGFTSLKSQARVTEKERKKEEKKRKGDRVAHSRGQVH